MARRQEDKWNLWDQRVRDIALFIFGAIGFFHELLIREEPHLYMIIASGALMGIPLVLQADEKRRTDGDADESQ